MKRVLILLLAFVALALFVYFYEIEGRKDREEAQRLEESLFRLKQEEIGAVEIRRPEEEPILLEKVGDQWNIQSPIETTADDNTVDSLVRNIALAKVERTFPEGATELTAYGLDEPKLVLRVRAGDEEKTIRIGNQDYTGNRVYVHFEGDPRVHLTSDYLLNTADKDLLAFRSKRVLPLDRDEVHVVEIERPGEKVLIRKREDQWELVSPLEDRGDSSAISSLLSSLEFAETKRFVTERAEDLASYGLDRPVATVRIQERGDDRWKSLQLGRKEDDGYVARNPDRSPIFVVAEELFEKLHQSVWELRNKDVVDVAQDQVVQVAVYRGDEEILVRREDYRWLVEKPEDHKDQETYAYKFWFPIDDIAFESIDDSPRTGPPEADVRIEIKLKDDSVRTFEFGRQGNRYWARQLESGRVGTISEEAFERLQFKIEDLV